MPFKHLFIYRHRRDVYEFIYGLEQRTMYAFGSSTYKTGHNRISIWRRDGEHEIIFATVDEIRNDRHRGLYFDKVSIHETVELTREIHEFLQMNCARQYMGMKFVVDRNLKDNEMYFMREPEMNPYLVDALYGLMNTRSLGPVAIHNVSI
jgi:hypothetical protein